MPVKCWLIIWPSAGPARQDICLVFAGMSFRVTCLNKPLSRWWTVSGLMLYTQRTQETLTGVVVDVGPASNIELALGRSPVYTVNYYSIRILTQ